MISGKDDSAGGLVRRIVENSVEAVRPRTLFGSSFRVLEDEVDAFGIRFRLPSDGKLKCISIGKSAEAMALEVRKRLGERVNGMIATSLEKHFDVADFEFFKTGHPYPDEISIRAGEAALELVTASKPEDVLIVLISGGGSASIFVPIEGVSLADANRVMKLLFDNAVPIENVNLVRRHISKTAGGKLALASKSRVISLIISDVVGDDPAAIASGPTCRDNTTAADALRFLEESGFADRIPKSVVDALNGGPAFGDPNKTTADDLKIIASNREAIAAAVTTGTENGFNTVLLTSIWQSEAIEAAKLLVGIARSIESDGAPVQPPALVLAAGETTVKVSGKGRGGRNQQLVLHAMKEMYDLKQTGTELSRTTVFSFGTDGRDGNTTAAGAYGSLGTLEGAGVKAEAVADSISNNDSNAFFASHGGLIMTGSTDTNVMDIFGIVVV